MFKLSLTLACLLAVGCSTIRTEMVSMRYKPTKSGVVRYGLDKPGATKLMNQFCAPDRAEIVEVTQGDVVTGQTATVMPRTQYMPTVVKSRNSYERATLVNFECVAGELPK